jgi:hypothetical protein
VQYSFPVTARASRQEDKRKTRAHDNVPDSAQTSRICPETGKTRSSESRKLENLIFSVLGYAKPLLGKKDIIARASL